MISIRIAVAAWALAGAAFAEEPPAAKRYALVAPMAEGLNAVAINGKGDVVGFHWEPENGDPNVLYEAPFFARGAEIVRLPLLETYTATFPAGVSDGGVVVGRASKPAPPQTYVHLRNQAFVWTAGRGIRGLGAPEPDRASFATGVSRDGRRIAGIGMDDKRRRVVTWDSDGEGWRPVTIPDADDLGSNVVAISPDGKRLAAVRKGKPTLWTEASPGEWKSESLDGPEGYFIPRAVNDAGTVVGFRNERDGTLKGLVWTREGGARVLAPPAGFQHVQPLAVNHAGVVVGMVDSPHQEPPGPHGFVSEGETIRIIDEAGPGLAWATAINDAGQITGVVQEVEVPAPADPEKEP